MREVVNFRKIKKEIRIVGIDDAQFIPRKQGKTVVVGIVFRGGYWLDGVMRTEVEVDGFDATEKVAEMIRASPHYRQLRIVMLNGITLAGFNVVDIRELFELIGLPVIALTREEANMDDVRNALMKLTRWEERWEKIQRAGEMFKFRIGDTEMRMQAAGISREDAERIVRISCTRGNIPEPLRVAHIVASGIAEKLNQ